MSNLAIVKPYVKDSIHRKIPRYNLTTIDMDILSNEAQHQNVRITAQNWPGIIYRVSRRIAETLVPIKELYSPGIYVKTYRENNKKSVYIGSSSGHNYGVIGSIFDSIDDTCSENWTDTIIITAQNDLLDEEDAEYLNCRLIAKLKNTHKFTMLNDKVGDVKINFYRDMMLDGFLSDVSIIGKIADVNTVKSF